MKTNPHHPVALIMTSDIATATFLRKLLRLEFQIIERPDIFSAQETLRTTLIDIVFLDSQPLEEGQLFLALSRLRTSVGKKKTPILVLTNNLKKKFAQDALRAGATDFINLPLDEEEVEQRIAVAFQSFERIKNVSMVAKRATPQLNLPASSLSNRQLLNDHAIKEISKARQKGGDVSLLLIELDTKKTTSVTEKIHSFLIECVQAHLRKNDILIPQSLGKLLVTLPKTSKRAAELIAESIRLDVASHATSCSVSIGLITWEHSRPSRGSSAEEFDHLIEGATLAVAEARKKGNRIISSEPV